MSPEYRLQAVEAEAAEFELLQRQAKALVQSSVLPQHFRNIGSVIALKEMSRELNLPMLMLAQNIYFVKGSVGMSGQLVIALLNRSGIFEHGVRWDVENEGGDDWRVRAWGVIDGEKVYTEWIDADFVRRMGWGNNPYWVKMPIRMARYRTAAFLARDYAPEVLMGFRLKDELDDIGASEDVSGGDLNRVFMEAMTNRTGDGRQEVLEVEIEDPKDSQDDSRRQALEKRARELGIKFRSNIHTDTLQERVSEAEARLRQDSQPDDAPSVADSDTARQDEQEGVEKSDEADIRQFYTRIGAFVKNGLKRTDLEAFVKRFSIDPGHIDALDSSGKLKEMIEAFYGEQA